MNSFISSDLFLLTLTTGLFCLGGIIYRRTRLALLHPVLLTFVAMIVFLQTPPCAKGGEFCAAKLGGIVCTHCRFVAPAK